MKKVKIIYWTIIVIAFFTNGYFKDKKVTENWHKSEYSGIIDEIYYYEGNRGFPCILINDNWK